MSNIAAKAIIFSTIYKIAIEDVKEGGEEVSTAYVDMISDACIESTNEIFNRLRYDPYDE